MTTKVAFLFPGQGSQSVGMGADIYASSQAAKRVFAMVDAALGFSLSDICFQGPEDVLRATNNAQSAIVTVSLALLAAFQEALSPQASSWTLPLTPDFTAGHSVGECTALIATGALDLEGGALLVRERGRLMHHEGTVCPSGMAAIIGLNADSLQEVCEEATRKSLEALSNSGTAPAASLHPGQGRVVAANFNAPGQIVIAGERQALDLAIELAKARGAKRAIPLAVSGAFHSPVMQPVTAELARALRDVAIHDATIPVVSNISAEPLTDAQALREELPLQVASSVQWTRSIEYMVSQGVTTFIEIGPGQALTGMVKRIAKGVTTINIGNAEEIARAVTFVRDAGLLHAV
jgi:[acyl-carrier-protein] S-malonyltransferase